MSDENISEWIFEVERLRKENKILKLKVSHSLANNLCLDHRDKQSGKSCLACEIERLQKSLTDVVEGKTMPNNIEELIDQLNNLTIDQMLELVKKSSNTTGRRFQATGPKGSMQGTILDPYLGLLQFDGNDGFEMASEFRFVNDVKWKLL